MKKINEMQLRRLTLFSSGVGFFEHGGDLEGDVELTLTFNRDAVNDALKSLVINDPDASPTVSYLSEDTLQKTMKGLSIDLHGNNHVSELLSSLKGVEVEIFAPNSIICVQNESIHKRNLNSFLKRNFAFFVAT